MGSIHRLSELIEDWQYFWKRDGFPSSLPLILSDVVQLPYRHLKFVILARSLNDPLPNWEPKIQLFIRLFEQSDLDLVRQIDRPSEAKLCSRRLAQGNMGLVAFYHGLPAGYSWWNTDNRTQLERVHPELSPGDVLCTDSFTVFAYRGQGVQTALTQARFQILRDLGYCRAICYIEVRNRPSLAVWQRKFNSATIGTIDFRRIGPWYRVRYSGNTPMRKHG